MIQFSPDKLKKAEEIIARYPEGKQKAGLLPILHLVQAEYGWLSSAAMDAVAGPHVVENGIYEREKRQQRDCPHRAV